MSSRSAAPRVGRQNCGARRVVRPWPTHYKIVLELGLRLRGPPMTDAVEKGLRTTRGPGWGAHAWSRCRHPGSPAGGGDRALCVPKIRFGNISDGGRRGAHVTRCIRSAEPGGRGGSQDRCVIRKSGSAWRIRSATEEVSWNRAGPDAPSRLRRNLGSPADNQLQIAPRADSFSVTSAARRVTVMGSIRATNDPHMARNVARFSRLIAQMPRAAHGRGPVAFDGLEAETKDLAHFLIAVTLGD